MQVHDTSLWIQHSAHSAQALSRAANIRVDTIRSEKRMLINTMLARLRHDISEVEIFQLHHRNFNRRPDTLLCVEWWRQIASRYVVHTHYLQRNI